MKTFYSMVILSSLALLAMGCQKDPLKNMTDDESRIYITDHDSTARFSDFHTFCVSDSAALIVNGQSKMQFTAADAAYIQAVKDQMQARGYVLVSKNDNPDLGLTVNRIISTTTGVISYGSYWDYYDTYWDPYYWGYPGYGYYLPYSYAVYQVSEGAVSIDMVDLKDANKNQKLDVIWTGLIRGSGIYNDSVAPVTVKALFDQSPYLQTN
ncbi:MAG: DUF4136 domain-containing protein [Proteobacteria bacterium]|nr:DUF4136 domain-containing protein [Pseudomonadota bacterium]MBS1920499.1 DUF4136 domain-containing protein [Bacteroidota bacterium]MBS1931102.1 DUF4136 domain-containing protein [Bacteroidota bacterium]